MALILVVDDDADFRSTLTGTLTSMGHEVLTTGDGEEGLSMLTSTPNVELVFVDYRMPGMDGIEFLRRRDADDHARPVPVVVLTAFASGQNTIDAMRLGAFDHLTKPIGRADVAEIVARALATHVAMPGATPARRDDGLLGGSAAMRQVQKRIGLAAASDVPVLVTGETGTGKEMVARALHYSSARANGPFVAVNCVAIPSDLMESELFGHTKGAFSGATADRRGHFREADGGTLLLDEIGDMPLPMQAKLLRVLQEGEVTPLGSSRPIKLDVRIVAATHRDMPARIAAGAFRQDLYYRLNVVPIELSPLRERPDDLAELALHFLHGADGSGKQLTDDAMR